MFVFNDSFNHLGYGGTRSVVGAARLHQCDYFTATFACAIDDFIDCFFGQKVADGNPGHGTVSLQEHHLIAMSPKH